MISESGGSVQVISVDPPATSSVNMQSDVSISEAGGSVQPIGIDHSVVQSQSIQEQSADTSVTGTTAAITDVTVSPQNCLLRSPDTILKKRPDAIENSPCSAKRGVPVWFKGNISSAFSCHIFYPSPPKKAKTGKLAPMQLVPACVSTKKW